MPEFRAGAVRVILNATAGTGSPGEQARGIEQKLRQRGLDAHASVVQQGADIGAIATKAVQDGARMVVAGGGDGTISSVASRLADTGVVLGVLPLGTLNHFAKDLGIPLELDDALDVIAGGRVMAVDAGEVNGRLFINNSGLGLYPDVVRDRDSQRRRLGRGKWAALAAACLHATRRYPVLSLHIEIGGHGLDRRSAFVFIGNNEYHMEGFNIGEREALTAGELSLYMTQRTGRFGLLRLALLALIGRLRQARDFDMLTADSLVVHTRKARIRVSTDGEVTLMETPLHYRTRPGALRVMVPAQSAPEVVALIYSQ